VAEERKEAENCGRPYGFQSAWRECPIGIYLQRSNQPKKYTYYAAASEAYLCNL
jgi:hypothetical protein